MNGKAKLIVLIFVKKSCTKIMHGQDDGLNSGVQKTIL